ncbi:MAG: TniQ family protein [Ignavibacteria bacterium]|nr:TniQ family protein [Ignavibacteria bacterium]
MPLGRSSESNLPSGNGESSTENIGLNASDLFLRHRLLPYYNAYTAPIAYELAFESALVAERRSGRPLGSAEVLLPKPSNLRFCPAYLQEILRCGQDLHWKRVHQLAIIAVCPIHCCDLLKSTIAISPNDRTLYPPTTESCGESIGSRLTEVLALADRNASSPHRAADILARSIISGKRCTLVRD